MRNEQRTFPEARSRAIGWAASLALVLLASGGCQQGPVQGAEEPPKTVSPLSSACSEVRLQTWPETVRVQGSLLADEYAVVGAKVAGRVQTVAFDLGATVERGVPLAVLDQELFVLRVRQAQAAVDQACAKLGLTADQPLESLDPETVPAVIQEKAIWDEARGNLERGEALSSQHVISTEEFQARRALCAVAEAKYRTALNGVNEERALLQMRRAELGVAQQNLADATIHAPFAATVQERHVAPGVYLGVGQPVATLVKVNPLRFRAGVPERQAVRVALGQAVRVFVTGEEQPRTATITRISPALDPASRSLTVEADLENPGGKLRVGLFAEGEIVIDPEAQALVVPVEAIWEFAGVEKVWRVQDGQAAEQPVKTGRRTKTLVEILSGLKPGDVVLARAEEGRAGPVTPK